MRLEADASKQPGEKSERARPEKKAARERANVVAAPVPPVEPDFVKHTAASSAPNAPQMPGIYINLQIHISADSTPDQIDEIFKSMAKHIYQRGCVNGCEP